MHHHGAQPFLLDSSPCPQHALGTASEGESLATGPASTSQDGEGLPPSRPALCPELKGDERGIVSQPKRRSPQVSQERLCGRLPAVIPSSLWGLSQAWGDSLRCTKGGLLPQLSGLQAELQDSLTFSAETSFSTSGPSRPLCRARPRPPAQRGQEPGDGEEEGGQRRARQEAQWPLPGLFLCCSCVTTEKSREVPQPSCLSSFERKGTKWRRAAARRPGLRLQFPIPPARNPPVSSVRQH